MERSRRRSQWILLLVASLVATSSLVSSQEGIETIPGPTAYVKTLSKDVPLLCRSSKPASDCSVRIPGYMNTYGLTSLPEGISPYGNGECGIRIGTFKQINVGKFQCNLTIGGESFQRSIEVVQAVPPEPTDIELGPDTITTEDGAAPTANITLQLDGEPFDSKYLRPLEFSETIDKKGRKLVTASQDLNYPITIADNGKKLVCRAEHFAVNKGFLRSSLLLDIRFPPQPIPTIYIGGGVHTMVNVTIKANPRPQISWKVNGMTIEEGQSFGPYQSYYPRDMDFGSYLILLKINERTDRTAIFELVATNELGTQTYVIKASKQGDDGGDHPEDAPEQTGSGAVFWLISIWTFFCSVIVSCLLSVPSLS
uniref:Putative neurotrophic tyrosine kinase receptor type 2b n=1 Tax=Psorophora albipes TaxID=869069 RepID=T1DEE0_9DIPT